MAETPNTNRTPSSQLEASAPRPAITGRASRSIGGCFALAAFAVAVISGLAAGNAASLVLVRAILAMLVCYPVGLLIGMICTRVIDSHLREQLNRGNEPQRDDDDNNATGDGAQRTRSESVGESAQAA